MREGIERAPLPDADGRWCCVEKLLSCQCQHTWILDALEAAIVILKIGRFASQGDYSHPPAAAAVRVRGNSASSTQPVRIRHEPLPIDPAFSGNPRVRLAAGDSYGA